MRILHYFFGFHRQGGLNRYAADLAVAQAAEGEDVFVLYPTGFLLPQKRSKIHSKGKRKGVCCFSLTGGRCVPLLEGILNPKMILEPSGILSEQAVSEFLKLVRPDVLHIHTWMGFPEELLPAAQQNGTKIIYTTHDYFGLCPMVNRLKPDGTVCDEASDQWCSMCNCHAPDERYLELRNAEVLIRLKPLLLPLKKLLHRSKGNAVQKMESRDIEIKPYEALKQHYLDLFRRCDKIHFNSPVTQAVFSREIPDLPGEVIAITHSGIADRSPERAEIHQPLNLAFFGSAKPYKGLPMLLKTLRQLREKGLTQWRLDIYGCEGKDTSSVYYHGFFDGAEEWEILAGTDLLIVPSIWDETFGFVVEEALCAGVPVLCSDKVGAKMLLDGDWIFSGETELLQKLKEVLSEPSTVLREKEKTGQTKRFIVMADHVKAMDDFYLG